MNGNRKKILLVDDNKPSLTIGKDLLKYTYSVYPADSADMMFAVLEQVVPDLILLDVAMPQMDGFGAIRKLKADRRFADIPVIFLTAKSDLTSEVKGFELGAADYIIKPFSSALLLKRIENQLLIRQQREMIRRHSDSLSELANKKIGEVLNLQNAIINAIADLVEFRDDYTGGHNLRAQLYMKALINGMLEKGLYIEEVAQWNLDLILPSSQLHDVGKIAVPDAILSKPASRLTEDEENLMKAHVTIGVDAIKKIISNTTGSAFLHHALRLVGAHHEKWDGTGYPAGLKGGDIPLEGRLMAVADTYDMLISRRSNTAATHEEARRAIEERGGTFFDPAIVGVFTDVADEFERVSREHLAG